MEYKVPAARACFEQEIKKSRFIAWAGEAPTPEAAHAFIDEIRKRYADARHICWAFISGEPGNSTQLGFSDAGEPNGTAGMPMLNVIQHGSVGDIVVVVVRYFGGIKLGTGGLARAYSSSVSEVLKKLPTKKKVAMIPIAFSAPFAMENPIRHLLQASGVSCLQVDYSEDLLIQCEVPEDRFSCLADQLAELSKGKIVLER